MRSAPLFQLVMTPSSVLLMMASSADSMMAESQYGARSGLWSRVNHSAASPPEAGFWLGSSGIDKLFSRNRSLLSGGVVVARGLYSGGSTNIKEVPGRRPREV